jgi:hypothetical protein
MRRKIEAAQLFFLTSAYSLDKFADFCFRLLDSLEKAAREPMLENDP